MKQAQYAGGSGTGVDLTVRLADGQQRPRHVDQGESLPDEIGGVPLDPEFIDGLLEQADWTEYKPASKAPEKGGKS